MLQCINSSLIWLVQKVRSSTEIMHWKSLYQRSIHREVVPLGSGLRTIWIFSVIQIFSGCHPQHWESHHCQSILLACLQWSRTQILSPISAIASRSLFLNPNRSRPLSTSTWHCSESILTNWIDTPPCITLRRRNIADPNSDCFFWCIPVLGNFAISFGKIRCDASPALVTYFLIRCLMRCCDSSSPAMHQSQSIHFSCFYRKVQWCKLRIKK